MDWSKYTDELWGEPGNAFATTLDTWASIIQRRHKVSAEAARLTIEQRCTTGLLVRLSD